MGTLIGILSRMSNVRASGVAGVMGDVHQLTHRGVGAVACVQYFGV